MTYWSLVQYKEHCKDTSKPHPSSTHDLSRPLTTANDFLRQILRQSNTPLLLLSHGDSHTFHSSHSHVLQNVHRICFGPRVLSPCFRSPASVSVLTFYLYRAATYKNLTHSAPEYGLARRQCVGLNCNGSGAAPDSNGSGPAPDSNGYGPAGSDRRRCVLTRR